jgi:hypothetical protein
VKAIIENLSNNGRDVGVKVKKQVHKNAKM